MRNEPSEPNGNGTPRRDPVSAEMTSMADIIDAAAENLRKAARLLRSTSRPTPAEQRPSAEPPRSPDDRLTSKQLGAIHAIARRAGISRDRLAELVLQMTGKDDVAALERSEASAVIDRLRAVNGE